MSKHGLKPLEHYLKEEKRKQSPEEMRANMLILARRVNRVHKQESANG